MIDHQHWHRVLAGLKLEAELVLNSREQAWRASLVHDYPALRLCKFAREQSDGVVAALDVNARAISIDRGAPSISVSVGASNRTRNFRVGDLNLPAYFYTPSVCARSGGARSLRTNGDVVG